MIRNAWPRSTICMYRWTHRRTLNPQVDHYCGPSTKSVSTAFHATVRPEKHGLSCATEASTDTCNASCGNRRRLLSGAVTQGHALREISGMPQIISGVQERALARARACFRPSVQPPSSSSPSKPSSRSCFANAWLHHLCNRKPVLHGLCENRIDYYAIWEAMRRDYPRMQGLPKAGFAAGLVSSRTRCSWHRSSRTISPRHSAMLVNEQLPRRISVFSINRFTSPTEELQYSA